MGKCHLSVIIVCSVITVIMIITVIVRIIIILAWPWRFLTLFTQNVTKQNKTYKSMNKANNWAMTKKTKKKKQRLTADFANTFSICCKFNPSVSEHPYILQRLGYISAGGF